MAKAMTIGMKKKLRKKRRRAIRRVVFLSALMVGIVLVLRMATDRLLVGNAPEPEQPHHVKAAASGAVTEAPTINIEQPIERHESEIIEDLEKYAKTSKAAAQIYEDRNRYPQDLLAAYLNNPEMEQFVIGYLNQDFIEKGGGLNDEEKNQEFPLLLQWDSRWGYVPYGGSVIGLSGCGPTCLSMVLISLTGKTEQTPDQIAQFSQENGYYVEGSGTAWALMVEGASRLGLSARELSLDETIMKAALDAGRPIICSMGVGDFTTQGHFVLIYGYDEEGFLINDPNCIARSGQAWTFERLRGQIKNMWAYSVL